MVNETLLDAIAAYPTIGLSDLDVLEYFGYRCGHCNSLLPVWGDSEARNRSKRCSKQTLHGTFGQYMAFAWTRAEGRVYCGFDWDHVIPVAQGGSDDWDNLVPSCISCNRRKSDRTPIQLLLGVPPFHRPAPKRKRRSVWDF